MSNAKWRKRLDAIGFYLCVALLSVGMWCAVQNSKRYEALRKQDEERRARCTCGAFDEAPQ